MEPKSKYEDDMDRYLRQDMSPEEHESFEQALRQDQALQREVALHRDVTSGIDLFGGEMLKRRLKAVGQEGEGGTSPPSRKGRPLYGWLSVAASLGVLLLVAILLFNSGTDLQELYAAYYEPYPNVVNPVERSEGIPTDAADQAMYYYERGEFAQAIELFTREPSLDDQAYRLYLAVSYLGVQNAESTIATLQPLVEDEQGAFYEPALWYLGLARLQANQPEQAREAFRKVMDLQGDYATAAREIMKEL